MDEPALLNVKDVTVRFDLGAGRFLTAVNRVSFEMRRGETYALVGESGSGKTTLGRAVLQLQGYDSGVIEFGGVPIGKGSKMSMREFRRRVQVVFQDPQDSLDPRITAAACLNGVLRRLTDLDAAGRRARVNELLEAVRLGTGSAGAYPHELTASEQQRLGIARALASGPDLIVLDEPTSLLDPMTREEIIGLLAELQKAEGTAYLFISHDLVTVQHIGRRIGVMYLGELVENGAVDDVFYDPLHPYTKALLDSAPKVDFTTRDKVDRLSGEIPSPIDLPTGCFLANRCPLVIDACRESHPELRRQPDGRLVRCIRVRPDPVE